MVRWQWQEQQWLHQATLLQTVRQILVATTVNNGSSHASLWLIEDQVCSWLLLPMIAIMLLQEALFSLHFTWLEAFFLPKATNKLATFLNGRT